MNTLVKLENISKTYATQKVIIDVSLQIHENQSIAILGNNGTGKSTLLQIVAGLIRPNAGNVIYPKQDLRLVMYRKDFLNFSALLQRSTYTIWAVLVAFLVHI